MKRSVRILSCALLSLVFAFLSVGYAVLSDELFISGEASVEGKPYEGVYISNVEVYKTSKASSVSFEFYKPTNLSATVKPTGTGGSITYKVTVHNNTNVTYWYIQSEFEKSFESNSLIDAANGITITTKDSPNDSSNTFNSDDWVPPQTYRDFYVTYTFGSAAQAYPSTLVNFLFGIKMDAIHDKFLAVLNDSEGGGYQYLSAAFDSKYAKTGEKVLANVGSEKEIFDKLFGSNMTVNIDGTDVPVTVVVRRENVDGRTTGDSYSGSSGAPTGCEYTVYITVDALNSPTGKAIVYAVSYSNGGVAYSDDTWYQLGQLYEGTANIIDYDKSTAGMQGAVDITTWIASPNKYQAANGITYLVGQDQGDQYDKLKTLEQIMSTNDQDIFNDIDNSQILKNVYAIVNNSANSNKQGIAGLREAFYAAAPFYNVMNGGQEVKVKRNCTRAEIIPYIINIQTALDYYNEVN